MTLFKLIFTIIVLFSFSSKANEVQVIDLHMKKNLDQLEEKKSL